MADGHGGYRRPSNPAAVSGPGALSARTDGGVPRMDVTGLGYGENGDLNAAQSAAPMSRPSAAPSPSVAMPTPLGDPSAFPDQPVTAGADAGPGPTSADIGLSQDENHEIRQAVGPWVRTLMRMADSRTATPAYRRQVRQLLARLN